MNIYPHKMNIYPHTVINQFKHMEWSRDTIFCNRDIMSVILSYMDQCEECDVLVLRKDIYCVCNDIIVGYYICKSCFDN